MRRIFPVFAFLVSFAASAIADPGNLDPSFDTNGLLASTGAFRIASQSDGHILILANVVTPPPGYPGPLIPHLVLKRLNSNGSVDTEFGGGGSVEIDHPQLSSFPSDDILVLPDDRVLVKYSEARDGVAYLKLARLLVNGTPDLAFGNGGYAEFEIGELVGPTVRLTSSILVQPDGKILALAVTSRARSSMNAYGVIIRVNQDGLIDSTFGNRGKISMEREGNIIGTILAGSFGLSLQLDGKLLTVETCVGGIFLRRFLADGAVDTAFGAIGLSDPYYAPLGVRSATVVKGCMIGLTRQADGKLVLLTRQNSGSGISDADRLNCELMRFTADGIVDSSFGTAGILRTDIQNQSTDIGKAIISDKKGRIVVLGSTDFTSTLVRYDQDGTLDPTFGEGGMVVTSVSCGGALALQPDGSILACGGFPGFIARFLDDGALGAWEFLPEVELKVVEEVTVVTPQTRRGGRNGKKKLQAEATIKNNGFSTDVFRVQARKSTKRVRLRYFDGQKEITNQITRGGYVTASIAPESTKVFSIQGRPTEATRNQKPKKKLRLTLVATSVNAPSKVDSTSIVAGKF